MSSGPAVTTADGRRAWEYVVLLGLVALAAWLRLRALELVEFKLDEATALDLARRLLDGELPAIGLRSSVGAANPPLFVYVIAIPLIVRDDPIAATAFVGASAVVAVALTYVVLRPRFGALAALTATALFASAPWAVHFGRKIWAQDVLPVVTVSLLWCLLVVLERRRSGWVAVVPVLLCVAFQLSFSALALTAPVAILLLYRAADVNWRAFGAGTALALVLLAPWLGHQAANGFEDVRLLATAGNGPDSLSDAGTWTAVLHTLRVVGATGWGFVSGSEFDLVRSEMGIAWTLGRVASIGSAALLVAGVVSVGVQVARSTRVTRAWPFLDMPLEVGRRALLLAWLVGAWLTHATLSGGEVHIHYLLVAYPVVFAVQGVLLDDLVRLVRGHRRHVAAAGIALVTLITSGFVAFTLGFHRFLEQERGIAGDYGVVYEDKAELARVVRERGLRIAGDPVLDFLVAGSMSPPPPRHRLVTVRNRLEDESSPSCAGEIRSVGPLEACLPPVGG